MDGCVKAGVRAVSAEKGQCHQGEASLAGLGQDC